MRISQKIRPMQWKELSQQAIEQAFVDAVTQMQQLPFPQLVPFYIRYDFPIEGTTGCLVLFGKPSAVWRGILQSDMAANADSAWTGLANVRHDALCLELRIASGGAKRSVIREALAPICAKAGLTLSLAGGEYDPNEQVNTSVAEPLVSSQIEEVGLREPIDTTQIHLHAQLLKAKAARFLQTCTGETARTQARQQLLADIPMFLVAYDTLTAPTIKLATFAQDMRVLYRVLVSATPNH